MSASKQSKKGRTQKSWLKCEKCQTHLAYSDLETHNKEECCLSNLKSGYIREGKLFVNSIEKLQNLPEELKGSANYQTDCFIYISESTLRLSNMKLAENVIVQISNTDNFLLRKIWPLQSDKFGAVQLSKKDVENIQNNDKTLVIQKLLSHPKTVTEIDVQLNCSVVEFKDDLSTFIKKLLLDMVIYKGYKLEVDFCNKKYEGIIKSTRCKIPDCSMENLKSKMENFSIGDNNLPEFYELNFNTKVFIVNNEKEDVELNKNRSIRLLGGYDDKLDEISEMIRIAHEVNNVNNMETKTTRSVLLYGPSGCGKSLLCDTLGKRSGAHIIRIDTLQIFSKFYGESETNLIRSFNEAYQIYPKPSVIIIENINNICPKNDTSDILNRLTSTFLNVLDNLHNEKQGSKIFILATTNNPDNIHKNVRRSGRLDYEIEISPPNNIQRKQILSTIIKQVDRYDLSEQHLDEIAKVTHGYVGADLAALISKALSSCDDRGDSKSEKNYVSYTDVLNALAHVKPSAMREILIESPNVKWSDIGGQHDIKLKLKQAIEWPMNHPEVFQRLGIRVPKGLLMFGPPGCSKTMIAKALATESKVNFLSIKGSELFSMWVGESEKAVRDLFHKARQVAPCIIFFDEIDAIGGERSSDSGSSVKERVLAQILTEIDGVNILNGVTIVAATNRPDLIDKALLRPGRLDRIVYVRLPDAETRREILKIKLTRIPCAEDVDIENLVERTENYSGAEIEAVCQEAALYGLEESFDIEFISAKHFEYALNLIQPRTSSELLSIYDKYIS